MNNVQAAKVYNNVQYSADKSFKLLEFSGIHDLTVQLQVMHTIISMNKAILFCTGVFPIPDSDPKGKHNLHELAITI